MKDRASAPPLAIKPWLDRGWRFFCSMRLALILILVLTAVVLVGTLVMQVPQDVKANPADYRWWLENPARERFGLWVRPMALLGLFDIFHSGWFLGAGFLLVVNISICTLNRWKAIWGSLGRPRVQLPDGFYQTGRHRISFSELASSPQQSAQAVASFLRRRGWRVVEENHPQALHLAADKNRFFRLATFLVHFSIILFIMGYLMTSYLGFRLNSFMVPEGSVRPVGQGTGLSLELISFVDEYWPEGPPKDFRSEIILYKDGTEVKRGLVRVNHYLGYEGVKFYQAFFGQATAMEVKDSQGHLLFNDAVALGWVTGKKPYQRPLGMFSLPEYQVYVIGPAQGYYDPLIKAGQVRLEITRSGSQVLVASGLLDQGKSQELVGLTFTFVREKQFSGFQVAKDPGNALIWLSSGLFTLGMILVFSFPYRQLWMLSRSGDRGTELLVRGGGGRSAAVAWEMEKLNEELKETLGLEKA